MLTVISALVPGGRAEERWRAQVRSLVHGAARVHRGVCPCARGLPAHGPRYGGGQEVPVSRESGCFDSSLGALLELQRSGFLSIILLIQVTE